MEKVKTWFIKSSWLTKVIILIVLVVGIWFTYTKFVKSAESSPTYQTAKVEKGTIVSSISASGTVTSANSFEVSTQVAGTVTKVYVKDGDQVKSGQTIAQLELDKESQQSYTQALASYEGAKNSLNSAEVSKKSLEASMVAAQQNFIKNVLNKNKDEDNPEHIQLLAEKEVAEEKYNNQDNVINQSKLSLSNAWYNLQQVSPIITAPASGTLTGLSLQIGTVLTSQRNSSNIAVSSRIANVITQAEPMISVELTELDVPKVKTGAKATITIDALPDLSFTGKVISIDTVGSISSGVTSYPTIIQLDSGSDKIFSNMSASASIILDSKNDVLRVPTSAVVNSQGQTSVRVLNNGNIEFIPVETGLSSDSYVEIVSGLTEGQEIIISVTTSTSATSSGTASSPFGLKLGGSGGSVTRVGSVQGR